MDTQLQTATIASLPPTYDYDLLVIGSGPAGEKAAIQAAKLNQTTQDWHSVPQKSPRAARGPLYERGRFRSPPLLKGG